MLAVAVPFPSVPLTACTVIVRTWFVPTAFVSVAGLISIHAFTHVLEALPLPPAAVLAAVAVVRVLVTTGPGEGPTSGMSAVAPTTVVPVVADVIVTVQLAVVVALPTTV